MREPGTKHSLSTVYFIQFFVIISIVPGIICIPDESNLRYFHIEIDGPADTPYFGGVFRIEMFLPDTCMLRGSISNIHNFIFMIFQIQ